MGQSGTCTLLIQLLCQQPGCNASLLQLSKQTFQAAALHKLLHTWPPVVISFGWLFTICYLHNQLHHAKMQCQVQARWQQLSNNATQVIAIALWHDWQLLCCIQSPATTSPRVLAAPPHTMIMLSSPTTPPVFGFAGRTVLV